jgi:beta-galactosidase
MKLIRMRDKPYMSGQFLWSGFDYLGESVWPNTTAQSGLFNRIGGWKSNGLQRQSWWSDKPVVHIVRREGLRGNGQWLQNWSPSDSVKNDTAHIQVYSNCDVVELFLNDSSMGYKSKPVDDAARVWNITYVPGTLKAVGTNRTRIAAVEELRTAGPPAKIILTTDQSTLTNSWDDVAYVTATIVDANGTICPLANNNIQFSIEGAGVIEAVDNGNNASHDIYKATAYNAYRGVCVALIKGNGGSGKVVVKAGAEGLSGGNVVINVVK